MKYPNRFMGKLPLELKGVYSNNEPFGDGHRFPVSLEIRSAKHGRALKAPIVRLLVCTHCRAVIEPGSIGCSYLKHWYHAECAVQIGLVK